MPETELGWRPQGKEWFVVPAASPRGAWQSMARGRAGRRSRVSSRHRSLLPAWGTGSCIKPQSSQSPAPRAGTLPNL